LSSSITVCFDDRVRKYVRRCDAGNTGRAAAKSVTDVIGKVTPPVPDSVQMSAAAPRPARIAGTSIPPNGLIFRENVRYVRYRRAFDVAAALAALSVLMPILLLACIAILIEDGRPVFFCQRRVGRFGRIFVMYKLRTMRKETCVDRFAPASRFDPRVTRIGHSLRRLSIDEIPQLINVIRGDMALVGPRPEMPFVVREYADWQNLRHLVTPGVTGLWQATCRKTVPLHLPEATQLDLDYIRRASYLTDVLVLVKTVRTLISSEGAY
jgi:lipopolysaccharide/colanic/teichoic acid biosynthesis glycosyltransferase